MRCIMLNFTTYFVDKDVSTLWLMSLLDFRLWGVECAPPTRQWIGFGGKGKENQHDESSVDECLAATK